MDDYLWSDSRRSRRIPDHEPDPGIVGGLRSGGHGSGSAQCLELADPVVHLVEYEIGDTTNRVANATNPTFDDLRPPVLKEMGGSELEHASLSFKSKVCEIGAQVLKTHWPQRFLTRLRDRCQHLNVINEVWWLARFPEARNAHPSVKLNKENVSDKNVDWAFAWQTGRTPTRGFTVNLEVKRRPNDIVRKIHGVPPSDLFDDVLPKFRPSKANEINAVGVTVFGEIDDSIKRAADDFLRLTDKEGKIDAVVVFSRFAVRTESHHVLGRDPKAAILRERIAPLDDEDVAAIALVEHLVGFPPEAIARIRLARQSSQAGPAGRDSGH